jgi:hypothetical protein
MRRSATRLLGLGALAAAAFAIWRAWNTRARAAVGPMEWDSAPFPVPPVPRPAAPAAEPWVEPRDGTCPATHTVKAKLTSGIYHLPGGLNYERTRPDRCYLDAAAAERDGLRQSKL